MNETPKPLKYRIRVELDDLDPEGNPVRKDHGKPVMAITIDGDDREKICHAAAFAGRATAS